jgi:predicted nucleic acid-binding protein
MRIIVCDAGPIIHLHEAHCLSLLRNTGKLFLPYHVYLEVQTAVSMETRWPEWLQIVKLSSDEKNSAGVWQLAGGIHAGEAEALVLARQKGADWFLTDDAATRLFISLLGVEVHGSLGVVLWNAAHKHINRKETESALKRLEQSSLWLSERIYQEALEALDDICSIDE